MTEEAVCYFHSSTFARFRLSSCGGSFTLSHLPHFPVLERQSAVERKLILYPSFAATISTVHCSPFSTSSKFRFSFFQFSRRTLPKPHVSSSIPTLTTSGTITIRPCDRGALFDHFERKLRCRLECSRNAVLSTRIRWIIRFVERIRRRVTSPSFSHCCLSTSFTSSPLPSTPASFVLQQHESLFDASLSSISLQPSPWRFPRLHLSSFFP